MNIVTLQAANATAKMLFKNETKKHILHSFLLLRNFFDNGSVLCGAVARPKQHPIRAIAPC